MGIVLFHGSFSHPFFSTLMSVNLPGESAFVPQEDHLHGFFTVKSYMKHYARLSGMKLPPDELEQKIDGLIAQLGLTEQASTIVGDLFLKGLSGGQKRRLSICLEALTDPRNFFLDEPTSGLGMKNIFFDDPFVCQSC
jgi:ABC-type multidrug transport system ATPase subunit